LVRAHVLLGRLADALRLVLIPRHRGIVAQGAPGEGRLSLHTPTYTSPINSGPRSPRT
jgi:hypothetical protein